MEGATRRAQQPDGGMSSIKTCNSQRPPILPDFVGKEKLLGS